MARLTGLQIQKLLPRTNCKECGSNTCLAFAMKLAAGKADLSLCPEASEEARRILGAAAEPPVREVSLGPDGALKVGAETVLYRHEKTFVHQTALAVAARDPETLAAIRDYRLERVGQVLAIDLVAVVHDGEDAAAYGSRARKIWQSTGKPLVLRSSDPAALAAAAEAVEGSRSVLASATPETADSLWPVARDRGHALAVTAPDLDQLAALAARVKEAGFNDLVLEFRTHSTAERFQTRSIARRAALKSEYKPLGYPSIHFVDAKDPVAGTVEAVGEIAKYGGIVVLPTFDAAQIAALMTLRLNIYTDPQKPIQVEPKVYAVGEPTPESPVFLTTNFSLTYFIVTGEIENSGRSAWLVVPECEGMSVLTAWAAGKFTGATVAAFCKDVGLERITTRREIVIPGHVSQISGDLEECLPGWTAIVGPQEASDLEAFIKARL